MFKPSYLSETFSICLRCQYRFIARRRRLREDTFPIGGIEQPRRFSHRERELQAQVLYDEVSLNTGDSDSAVRQDTFRHEDRPDRRYVQKNMGQNEKDADHTASAPHQETTDLDYRPDLRYGQRHVKLYRKDALGVDSLGRPAEVLVLTTPQKQSQNILHVTKPDERVKEDPPGSADEMLGKLRAEKGIPSERGIAENIEELRDTWISHRKRKGRPLSSGEQEDLVERLDSGFTVKQLVGYYVQAGARTEIGPADLDLPYSTHIYTRSAWHVGSTPFPGDASARLRACRLTLDGLEHTEVGIDGDSARSWVPTVKLHTPKHAVIERILWECWHLRSGRNEEATGELDIWILPEHNQLLLNHNRDILRRLSERYGAKIDTSRSQNIIRVTADRGVCGDIFGFVVYLLHRIESEEVDLRSVHEIADKRSDRLEAMQDTTYLEELQQLTNTIIKPVRSEAGKRFLERKAIIYFLGPSKDDFVDAQRLLLQSARITGPRISSVHWGGPSRDFSAVPSPVDVGSGIPIADRTRQWSRWVLPHSKKSMPVGWQYIPNEKPRKIVLKTANKAYQSQIIQDALSADVSDNNLRCWPSVTSQSLSLGFGKVIYPTKAVKRLNVAARGPASERLSSAFMKNLHSTRHFVNTNLDLKPPRIGLDGGKLQDSAELRILMTPTPIASQQANSRPTPNLDIGLFINQSTKTMTLRRVRLLFETRQSDLVLPDLPADLRFATKLYASANISTGSLPPIDDFLERSNLNIWGTDRLKTPPNLTLPIPQYSIQNSSGGGQEAVDATAQIIGPSSPVYVDYAFAALEHRCNLVERRGDYKIEYFFIEAGRTGGRKEGLRITGHPTAVQDPGAALTEVANGLIAISISTRARERFSDIDTEVALDAKPDTLRAAGLR